MRYFSVFHSYDSEWRSAEVRHFSFFPSCYITLLVILPLVAEALAPVGLLTVVLAIVGLIV